jgi:tripartite motif-containing protein 2/3
LLITHYINSCLALKIFMLSRQVFDSSGSFLSYIHTGGEPLYGPQGLDLSQDGQVIVADSGNHCLKMYKYLQ